MKDLQKITPFGPRQAGQVERGAISENVLLKNMLPRQHQKPLLSLVPGVFPPFPSDDTSHAWPCVSRRSVGGEGGRSVIVSLA
jgi:hypothetical protein